MSAQLSLTREPWAPWDQSNQEDFLEELGIQSSRTWASLGIAEGRGGTGLEEGMGVSQDTEPQD